MNWPPTDGTRVDTPDGPGTVVDFHESRRVTVELDPPSREQRGWLGAAYEPAGTYDIHELSEVSA